jgi:hypothetical protein
MVGWTGEGTGERRQRTDRHPAAATCFPGESLARPVNGDAVGFGAISGRGGGGCMATEKGKEACSMLPVAMATTTLFFRGFLCGDVRGRVGGNERKEKSVPPLFPPLSRCCPSSRVHAARVAAAVRGACCWPGVCAYLDTVYGAEAGGDTTVRPRSTAKTPRPSVRRTRVWSPRWRDAADAHTRAPALQLYVVVCFYFVVLLSKLQNYKNCQQT